MARDDLNYFRSFSPKLEELERLRRTLGTLLLPMDATPSPLLKGKAGTPQTDCTRVALQVTRFATRAEGLDSVDEESQQIERRLVLGGFGSRIPGLRDYVMSRVPGSTERFGAIEFPQVELAGDIDSESMSDGVFNMGAIIEANQPAKRQIGLIGGALEAPPMGRRKCSVSRLKEGALYVLERKVEG